MPKHVQMSNVLNSLHKHTHTCMYVNMYMYVVFIAVIKEEVKNVRESRWDTREVEGKRGHGINDINTVLMFEILNKLNLKCSKELQSSNRCPCETK